MLFWVVDQVESKGKHVKDVLVGQITTFYSLGIPETVRCKNKVRQKHVTMVAEKQKSKEGIGYMQCSRNSPTSLDRHRYRVEHNKGQSRSRKHKS